MAPESPGQLPGTGQGDRDFADGEVPNGVTSFDTDYPAISRLDPALLDALHSAASEAADNGITINVNSGWRSKSYQARLFEQAVAKYGSESIAARWVARPGTSIHETGGAVDVGPQAAEAWLSRHGARYGLCQIYRNEPWHFEERAEAATQGCPRMYADASRDPRMK